MQGRLWQKEKGSIAIDHIEHLTLREDSGKTKETQAFHKRRDSHRPEAFGDLQLRGVLEKGLTIDGRVLVNKIGYYINLILIESRSVLTQNKNIPVLLVLHALNLIVGHLLHHVSPGLNSFWQA